MSDFNAEALAAEATGEEPAVSGTAAETTETHAAAEGADPSGDVGSSSTLRDMLLSSEPAPRLEAVEDPYDPERGGTTRIYRGLMKLTGVDGLPAIADIGIGVIEATQQLDEQLPGGSDEQADEDTAVSEEKPIV